ncbi:hypothetical protein D210916BOD24_28320 [Alteromonas sp. D210916BOD_24]|uniref:hypothetical protein n=1 Tax=Alteromonas sp. D210916BOD_24 TaxID=3157618 RepID=UPI00399CBA7A
MTERKLIAVLTDVCENEKVKQNGFVWLTHLGHWKSPEIVAVFQTEHQLTCALNQNWDIDFITNVNIALEGLKSSPIAFRFDSETACKRDSGGDWDKHLAKIMSH